MVVLEKRLQDLGLELQKKDLIRGAHEGNIYRLEVFDYKDEKHCCYIYKEFAPGRNNEVAIYINNGKLIEPYSELVKVWEAQPQAILMPDLNSPLKNGFSELPLNEKKLLTDQILQSFSNLHSSTQWLDRLPVHHITDEWLDWCVDQLDRLTTQYSWSKDEWKKILKDIYNQLDLSNYQVKGPLVYTHGDPHLENVFKYYGNIRFIDWEWAALGSPLRDITILLQDFYSETLIDYARNSYKSLLEDKQYNITDGDYERDFNHLYIDHLTMMLAWEIEKFFQGMTPEEEIKKITHFKLQEIIRAVNKISTD